MLGLLWCCEIYVPISKELACFRAISNYIITLVIAAITPGWCEDCLLTASSFISTSRPRASLPQERQLWRGQQQQAGHYFNHTHIHPRPSAMSGHRAGSERHPPRGVCGQPRLSLPSSVTQSEAVKR